MPPTRAHGGWNQSELANDDMPPLVQFPTSYSDHQFNYQHEDGSYGEQGYGGGFHGGFNHGMGGREFLPEHGAVRGDSISSTIRDVRDDTMPPLVEYPMPEDGGNFYSAYDMPRQPTTAAFVGNKRQPMDRGPTQKAPWEVSPSWDSYNPDWDQRPSTGSSVFDQTQMDEADDMPPPVDASGNYSPWDSPTMMGGQPKNHDMPFVFGHEQPAEFEYGQQQPFATRNFGSRGNHGSVFAYDHEESPTLMSMTLYHPQDASCSPNEMTMYDPGQAPSDDNSFEPNGGGSGWFPATRSSHAKKRDASYIPRPPNAFILFRSSFIKTQQVSGKVEGNHSTLSKIIGLQYWKTLPREEREKWEAKALVAQAEHRMRYPDWRFRPGANALAKAKVKDGTDPGRRRGSVASGAASRKESAATLKRDAVNAARRESAALKRKAAADALKARQSSEQTSSASTPGAASDENKEERERSRERRTTKIAGLLAEGKRGVELEEAILQWDGSAGESEEVTAAAVAVERPVSVVKTEIVQSEAVPVPNEQTMTPDVFVAYVPPKTPDPHYNTLGPLLSTTVPATPRRRTPGRPRKDSNARVLSTDTRFMAPSSPSKRKACESAESPQRRSRPSGARTTAPPSEDEDKKLGVSLTAMFRRSTSAPASNARIPFTSFSAMSTVKEPVLSPDIAMVPPSPFIHQRRDSLPVARRDKLPPLLFGSAKAIPESFHSRDDTITQRRVSDMKWREQESFSPDWNKAFTSGASMQDYESSNGYEFGSPGQSSPFDLDSCSLADSAEDDNTITTTRMDQQHPSKLNWLYATIPLNLPHQVGMPRTSNHIAPMMHQPSYTPQSSYSSLTGWAGNSPSSEPSPLSLISALNADDTGSSSGLPSTRTRLLAPSSGPARPEQSLHQYTAGLQAFGLHTSA